VDKRRKKMRLYKEAAIGCLHPIATAYPSDFFRKNLLLLPLAKVLNHRVANHYIEAFVLEWKSPTIPEHG
jgi:hypothetical protein